MDGFHVGGNLQLDFLEGQHVPGLVIGLNYQFLAKNQLDANEKEVRKQWIKDAKAEGATCINYYDYAFQHNIQIPVHFQYTYRVNNDWRIFVQTGPQVRLHVAFTDDARTTCRYDGKLNGGYNSMNWISGMNTHKVWLNNELVIDETSTIGKRERIDCFDMSWGFMFGFGWDWLSLNISYDYGMINLFNNTTTKEAKQIGKYYLFNSDALAVTLGFRLK